MGLVAPHFLSLNTKGQLLSSLVGRHASVLTHTPKGSPRDSLVLL